MISCSCIIVYWGKSWEKIIILRKLEKYRFSPKISMIFPVGKKIDLV